MREKPPVDHETMLGLLFGCLLFNVACACSLVFTFCIDYFGGGDTGFVAYGMLGVAVLQFAFSAVMVGILKVDP